MSFFGDAQEFPAIIFAELHIEMLALNLQFFRLNDVIHFSWSRRLYRNQFGEWKQNPQLFFAFVGGDRARGDSLNRVSCIHLGADDLACRVDRLLRGKLESFRTEENKAAKIR